MDRKILHIDINNCYASIELLHRPSLRSKPVVVGGDEEARHGIVLAKNDLAKKFKVKTGEVLWQAKQKCPDLVTIRPNYELYMRFAKCAREIYADYTDRIESFGLDEVWMDLTGNHDVKDNGYKVANEIKERIKFELGITVSVGVSWNKIFAKLGSDMKKPDAVTVISKDDFKEKVWPLPVNELLYVGPATTKKLMARDIITIGDLACSDPLNLRRFLHKPGEMLWEFANGYDISPVAKMDSSGIVKSIGNSSTCPRDLENDQDVKLVFYILAESVASRLRESGFEAGTVEISLRDVDLNIITRQIKLNRATDLAKELTEYAMQLFALNYYWEKPLRSIGIRGSDLKAKGGEAQMSLLVSENERHKTEIQEETIDYLRSRFGYYSIQRGIFLQDSKLTGFDAKNTHVIHPLSYRFS